MPVQPAHLATGSEGRGTVRRRGEEFVVIAPLTGSEGAAQLGERMRRAIGDKAIPVGDGPPITVTVSVGVASGEGDVNVLVADADAALCAAKRGGRNRVLTAGDTV